MWATLGSRCVVWLSHANDHPALLLLPRWTHPPSRIRDVRRIKSLALIKSVIHCHHLWREIIIRVNSIAHSPHFTNLTSLEQLFSALTHFSHFLLVKERKYSVFVRILDDSKLIACILQLLTHKCLNLTETANYFTLHLCRFYFLYHFLDVTSLLL